MKEGLDEILEESIKNIREDRKRAESLLNDLASYIGTQQDRHATVGLVASKYLETLQRSNEQLVKIASFIKDKKPEKVNLDKEETEDFYKEFEKEGKEGEKV